MIATVEYTDASQMLADYAARRARMYAPRPEPVAVVEAAPAVEPNPFWVRHDHIRDWISLATAQATKPGASTRVITMVSEIFGVSRIDLISQRRAAKIVLPRQICFYLMRHCTTLSFPEIGRRMGGRDHTTALHGARKIEALLQTKPDLRALVEELAARCRAEFA